MKFAGLVVVMVFAASALPAAGAAELTLDQKIDFINQDLDTDNILDGAVLRISDGIKDHINIASIEAIGRLNDIIAAQAKSLEPMSEVEHQVFKSVFSAEEIDILYKFYSSPDGQKILAKNRALSAATEAAVKANLQAFYTNVLTAMQADPELGRFVSNMPPRM